MSIAPVSIHAPARGATPSRHCITLRTTPFQSTLPHGERRVIEQLPAGMRLGFNPRSRTGSDDSDKNEKADHHKFQSTLPHGERHRSKNPHSPTYNGFNPRSRTGSDCNRTIVVCQVSGFNPRSRTGSDSYAPSMLRRVIAVSIHAPARGATHSTTSLTPGVTCFNPRSRTGSDVCAVVDGRKRDSVSIHAPARGATFSSSWYPPFRRTSFQSTLPHGERPVGVGSDWRMV